MISLYPDPEPRDPDLLLARGLAIIDEAFKAGAEIMRPLLSGGHDSFCATHIASQHSRFTGDVNFIKTRIGALGNRAFVDAICKEYSWNLIVHESPETYERFVRDRGFSGPGRHQWVYNRIKDRCVRAIVRPMTCALITGCRSDESERRMGHAVAVRRGEWSESKKRFVERNRVWTAPCVDWTQAEQRTYMDAHGMPRNPIKERTGMSGECWCGAFAKPNEIEVVRAHCPDVAEEIDRLAKIARACGKHDVWGTRPPEEPEGLIVAKTGMLCSGCDRRAAAAGLLFAP